jgi:hypothetical protein
MLQDSLFIGGVWVSSDVRSTNDVGTLLVSATNTLTGEDISDDYGLTIGAIAGGHGTVVVAANPDNILHNGRNVAGVALDGVTQYTNIINGVTLVFSALAVNGDSSTVHVGYFAGPVDAFGVGAGTPVAVLRHKVHNPDPTSVSGTVATITPEIDLVKKVGSVFNKVSHYAPGATYKPFGGGSDQVNPYVILITALAGAGPTKTVSFTIDGALAAADSIRRVADGSTHDSTGIKAVAGEIYEFITGNLTGFMFSIDPAVLMADRANVMVFPARFMQITADVAGVADGAGWGTDDVDVTQAGQLTGTILAAGDGYYWSRVVVPPGANSESDPFQMLVSVNAISSSPAAW